MNSLLVKISAIIALIPIIMFASKQVDGAVFSHYGAERVERPKSIVLTDVKGEMIDNRQSAVKRHIKTRSGTAAKPTGDGTDRQVAAEPIPELRGFAEPDDIVFEPVLETVVVAVNADEENPALAVTDDSSLDSGIPALRR